MITIPENYDNNHPYLLIFGYHWNGGNANDVDGGGSCKYTSAHYGLRALSDKSTTRAIFVAPDGIGGGWGNGGNSDVIFTDDMIKKIEEDLCIDTKHLFAHGFSYGGGMSKALACQRPNVFRAVAVYSGAEFLSGGCDNGSTSPVAFFGAHSISDPICGYSSGEAIRDRFVKNNGCTPQSPPKVSQSQLTHICTTYQGCKAGYPVEWCVFNGGGHTPAAVDGSTGCCNCDNQWIPPEVWKFFTQF